MYELQIFLEQSVISLYIFFYKKQYTSLFIQMGNIFSTFIKQTFCWKRLAFFSYISHTTWKRTNDNIKITFFLQKLRCRNNLDGEKWVKRFNYPFFSVLFCFFFWISRVKGCFIMRILWFSLMWNHHPNILAIPSSMWMFYGSQIYLIICRNDWD